MTLAQRLRTCPVIGQAKCKNGEIGEGKETFPVSITIFDALDAENDADGFVYAILKHGEKEDVLEIRPASMKLFTEDILRREPTSIPCQDPDDQAVQLNAKFDGKSMLPAVFKAARRREPLEVYEIRLPDFAARRLALIVLDYLRAWEAVNFRARSKARIERNVTPIVSRDVSMDGGA